MSYAPQRRSAAIASLLLGLLGKPGPNPQKPVAPASRLPPLRHAGNGVPLTPLMQQPKQGADDSSPDVRAGAMPSELGGHCGQPFHKRQQARHGPGAEIATLVGAPRARPAALRPPPPLRRPYGTAPPPTPLRRPPHPLPAPQMLYVTATWRLWPHLSSGGAALLLALTAAIAGSLVWRRWPASYDAHREGLALVLRAASFGTGLTLPGAAFVRPALASLVAVPGLEAGRGGGGAADGLDLALHTALLLVASGALALVHHSRTWKMRLG